MATKEQLDKLDAMAKPRSDEAIARAEERKKQRSKLIQGLQHCIEMMKEEELGILIDKLGILTKKFNTYDKLRSELWNLLNKYVATHNIRPDEEFQDFMLKNDGDVALFFINEYGMPSMAYHTVKIKDLCDGNDKED